jgi:hypothetical protein
VDVVMTAYEAAYRRIVDAVGRASQRAGRATVATDIG